MKIVVCLCVSVIFLLSDCVDNKKDYVPISEHQNSEIATQEEQTSENGEISNQSFMIPYKLTQSGVKTIQVKFNDVAAFDALFDTGCSGVVISLQEANLLLKSGTLTMDDKLGKENASIASGEIIENDVFNVDEISFIDTEGNKHTLQDVPVTVISNPLADVLVGDIVIDRMASNSYTVDLQRHAIIFK